MAPTACVLDYPIVGVGVSSTARSHYGRGRDGVISKRQRLIHRQFPKIADGIRTLIYTPPIGPIREADTASHTILPEANLPEDRMAQSTLVINQRQDLMDIVVRTLALVRRNYVLQVRLDSLRREAKNFFESVLNNQGSEKCQKHCDKKMDNNGTNVISLAIDDKINQKQIVSSSLFNKSQITSIIGGSPSDKNSHNVI